MPELSRRTLLTALAGTALLPACRTLEVRELVTLQHDASQPLRTIAMGSCLRQNRKQPVWRAIR
ncbi:MAG: alkaline phosphatase family protein, partial [Pseudomonadota bacterium]|nr:alkaline phosphatase family protein [Pseudomonadota bacterium]